MYIYIYIYIYIVCIQINNTMAAVHVDVLCMRGPILKHQYFRSKMMYLLAYDNAIYFLM